MTFCCSAALRFKCPTRRGTIPVERRAVPAQARGRGQLLSVYTSFDVQWSNFKKVMLQPVEFWNNFFERISR